MRSRLPRLVQGIQRSYPGLWKAFQEFGAECHQAGPLGQRTRRIVKVGIAAAAQSEGAVHSAVRTAQTAGVKPDEIRHAILLTIIRSGFREPWRL
jgi:alkylhydroperoxidase/carboxymuconolactone decarboxylase family protein YurZ